MKFATISVFEKFIIFGLSLQVLLLVCGALFFLQATDSLPSSNKIIVDKEYGESAMMQEAIKLAAERLVRQEHQVSGTDQDSSGGGGGGTARHHPLTAMIQSHAHAMHDPTQRRQCFAFTAVPQEIEMLLQHVKKLLEYDRYAKAIDCIHLSIPHRALRFGSDSYPTTDQLLKEVDDPRVIVHRLFDYGPMTRYMGPLVYEQHPDTSIVIFDMDSGDMIGSQSKDLVLLFHVARFLDTTAMWCFQGENFRVENGVVKPSWDTFPSHVTDGLEWNLVHFCRGVGGLLFKPKQFYDFWYNQSEYHESCFWDDDRWVGYQLERMGIPLKVVHAPASKFIDLDPLLEENSKENYRNNLHVRRRLLSSNEIYSSFEQLQSFNFTIHRRLGSLTAITSQLKSDQTCPLAWLKHHPDAFPTAQQNPSS